VRHILIIFSIFLFSFTVISCSSSSDDGSATTSTTPDNDTTTTTDTTPPTVSSSSPSDGDTSVSKTSTVSVTFSETMDTSSVSTNTLDTSCFGTFQVSSDSFTSCVQMSSSPTSSNSDKTFTITPEDNLSDSTIFRIRITTGTKDSSGNSLTSQWTTSSGFQTGVPPILTEVTVVTTPTNDSTPNYTFSSTAAGTITYGGSCSSNTTSAISGNNTITLVSLSDGTYENCKITVTDSLMNVSNSLTITSFTVDTTAPTVSSTSPSDSASSVSIGSTISVTFSESINNSSVTANTSNTTCSESMQLSSNNFSSCIQMSSTPSASNTNKTFSVTPSDNLSSETSYKIRVTTLVKDVVGNSMSNSYTTSNGFTSADITSPILSQVTAVSTPTNDNISSYTFSSTEAGTITYGGSCSSDNTTSTTDNNTVTFNALADGTYDNCTISVTDSASNASSTLDVNTFVVDTTAPTVSSISPTDNQSGVSISDNISVTFSESMDNTSVTTNTGILLDNGSIASNTSCSGSFQLSSDNFSSCLQMSSSPSSSNSYKTFAVASDNLSYSTTYKTRVTTVVKDSAGNTLSSQYETSSGFTTKSWTQQLGTSSGDVGTGVTVDSSNNIYVTGRTTGGLDEKTNSGSFDLFLVKYNSSGTKQWTQQLGTSGIDYGNGVTVDSSGNIYVTGHTEGVLDSNTNSGGRDIFLVKYNSSGAKQWTQQLGSSSHESGESIAVDSSNNIYVAGYAEGGLDSNTYSGSKDIILVKYNSSGTKQWTKQLGTSGENNGQGVVVDSSDNIYVTGYTQNGLDGNSSLGGNDIFLAKYYDNGTKQWTKLLGSSGHDYGQGIAVDSSDNIYITGFTSGGLDNNTSSGSDDIILVKYYDNGTKQWTQQLGTSLYDIAYEVSVDSSDNIYVTGFTSGGLDNNTNSGQTDIFLVKYNSSGTKQWTQQLGTSLYEYANGVTVDSSDNIYVTGSTSGGLDGNTNSGDNDIFLVKYNSDGVKQ
jgi:uncharacterized delta-60 repeat protein